MTNACVIAGQCTLALHLKQEHIPHHLYPSQLVYEFVLYINIVNAGIKTYITHRSIKECI